MENHKKQTDQADDGTPDPEFEKSIMDVASAPSNIDVLSGDGPATGADIADMAGSAAFGNSAVGGPTGLTARAAAVGSAEDLRDEIEED
ncbi:MAG: hypothetical protein ABI670_04270 [Chloroflexota bacterium]